MKGNVGERNGELGPTCNAKKLLGQNKGSDCLRHKRTLRHCLEEGALS